MFQDKKAVFLGYGLSFMWVSSNRLPSNPPQLHSNIVNDSTQSFTRDSQALSQITSINNLTDHSTMSETLFPTIIDGNRTNTIQPIFSSTVTKIKLY